MKYLPIYFLFFFSFVSFGQNQEKIDSLKGVLKLKLNTETKLNVLTKIFNTYLFVDLDSSKIYIEKIIKISSNEDRSLINCYNLNSKYYYYKYEIDSALFFAKKAFDISKKVDDNKLKSDLCRKLAILYSQKMDYENAEIFGKLSLRNALLTKDWNLIASSNIMLGNQYLKKNNFDISLKHYLKADSLYFQNNKKDRFLAVSYENIATIYTRVRDKKALYYIEKCNTIYKDLNNLEGVNYNYILKGTYYQTVEDYKNAILNFNKALPFYKKYGNVYRETGIYNKLAFCYSAINNFTKAEDVLKISERLLINSKDKQNLLELYLNQAQLYLDQTKYDKAIGYFSKSNKLIENNKSGFSINTIKKINKGLSLSYLGKKEYKNAYKYNVLLFQINDSINKKNNLKVTQELETKYQTEIKEQEIILLKSKNKLVEQQKISQRNILLGGIVVASIAGLFFFIMYRNRQKTTKKLQELDKAKSNFFANISHEFRTPLTLISGPIQKQLRKEDLSNDERINFEMISRNSNRLLSLVDQLLDLSKIEAGSLKLKISEGNVIPFLGSLTDSFTYTAKQKELNYIVESSATSSITWFDKDVVEKIIVNLLSNAVKYTPSRGTIQCNVSVKDSRLYIEVKNSGVGLSKEELTKVFERFYQIDENKQGVGIGLALVKELVALHKGIIEVNSTPNEWTMFKVMLPVGKENFNINEFIEDTSEIEVSAHQNSLETDIDKEVLENSEKPILLVVDDNADIRTYVGGLFKKGYTILSAKNGQEGVNLAIEHVPDIIISDIMMPIKNGIELCNTLKVDERTSHIPIILLTAKAGEENEIEGVKTGADDYVTKPFNEELLKLRVQKLFESRKKLQKRYSQEVVLRPKDIAVTSVDEQFLERLQKVMDEKLIESSYRIEDFSKAVGMSRMQLHRKLKALTGLSASEFIRTQRLKLAEQLLKKSEINVSQVGYSVGFNDHAYFSKCFKEIYGCTPTEYSKR